MVAIRLKSELRRTWRGLLALVLITAAFGGVVLVALAGARRTDSAVTRFLDYSGPLDGQVSADPATFPAIAALPEVAYWSTGGLFLAGPTDASGSPVGGGPGEVLVWAITGGRAGRVIIVHGRVPNPSRAGEAAVNESAALALHVHVGSVIHLRGYSPNQMDAVLSGTGGRVNPVVPMPDVTVVGIIRQPTDVAVYPTPSDITFLGNGGIFVGRAFFEQTFRTVANFTGISFKLKHGLADLPAFTADVHRVAGQDAQVEAGSDAQTAAVAARRGTSLEGFALVLFGGIAALSLLIVVGQNIARQTYVASDDYPTLRALGVSRSQLFALALARGSFVAVSGMLLAIPIAYLLSAFTPIGLARRAEIAQGFNFDAAVLLGGAAALALLLVARAAVSALRVASVRNDIGELDSSARASVVAESMARAGVPPSAVSGIRLAFEPGHGRSAVPVRSTIVGTCVALAALVTALVFGFSLNHLSRTPVLAGWNWDLAIGNPHSGDVRKEYERLLGSDPDVAAFSATTMGGGPIAHHDVVIAGIDPVEGSVLPPILQGRMPRAPDEIALGGIELRAQHKKVGDSITNPMLRLPIHIVGEVVLSPQIVNQQEQLGGGGVMTIAGLQALSPDPLPVNVFLVRLKNPSDAAAIDRLKEMFPGVVLPALAAPEIHNLQGVSSFPLVLAGIVTLLAVATIAHTLVTSVRRRRRDLAILKTLGFVRSQVSATVAWQSSALVAAAVVIGLPLGIVAGRWTWTTYAQHIAIKPVPAVSLLVLVLIPAALLIANLIAAVPARGAARTEPALVLRTE
jgi:hypothetical protein